MYHVSAQGVDERMINVHYYYDYINSTRSTSSLRMPHARWVAVDDSGHCCCVCVTSFERSFQWPSLTDYKLTFITAGTRVRQGTEAGVRVDVICTRSSVLTWAARTFVYVWNELMNQKSKSNRRGENQSAIKYNKTASIYSVICMFQFNDILTVVPVWSCRPV